MTLFRETLAVCRDPQQNLKGEHILWVTGPASIRRHRGIIRRGLVAILAWEFY